MANTLSDRGFNVSRIQICPLCTHPGQILFAGLSDRFFGVPGTWSFLKCPNCGLIWLVERPLEAELSRLYAQYYTHDELIDELPSLRTRIRDAVLSKSLGYPGRTGVLGHLLGSLPAIRDRAASTVLWAPWKHEGRLLDVGAGNGAFIAAMKAKGWSTVGVEPDHRAVNRARDSRLQVIEGTIETADIPEESFDVVTASHVIEHTADPVSFLKRSYRFVRSGGFLIVATPNVASANARRFRASWLHLDPPRHLFLFDRSTLTRVAELARLDAAEIRTASRWAHRTYLGSRIIKKRGALPEAQIGSASAIESLCARLSTLAGQIGPRSRDAGDELVLIARKS